MAGSLNDLWSFPLVTAGGRWTWLKGSRTINSPGHTISQGACAPENVPGARCFHSVAIDSRRRALYLFGGVGFTTTGQSGASDSKLIESTI